MGDLWSIRIPNILKNNSASSNYVIKNNAFNFKQIDKLGAPPPFDA